MAMFKSDAQGFLVGELVETNRDILKSQQQGMGVWKAIRTDVKSIARAVGVQVATATRNNRSGAPASGYRTIGGNFVGGQRPVATASRSNAGAAGVQRTATARAAVALPQRGANGRFIAGQARPSAGRGSPGSSHGMPSVGSFKTLSDSMARLSGVLHAADNVDPTLNAAKEIKEVVTPLGRGLFSLFGKSAERKKETWYRRILKALTPGAKSGEKAQAGGSFFGSGGGNSPGGGLLGRVLGKGAGLLKGGVGLLKRVPILGALMSGGLALGAAMGMNDDPSKTPEENRANRYHSAGEAAGMGVGGIAGAALGSLLGPLGTIGGGYVGSMIGEKVGGPIGDWSKSLMDSDLPSKMLSSWNAVTATLGSAWDATAQKAAEVWGGAKKIASTANAAVKNATGMDVGELASAAGTAVKAAGTALVPETVRRAVGAASDWALGKTSKTYESGRGGAGTVSSGKGDNGGASYGTYQLSSKSGTLSKFLAQSPYGAQFAGLTPGSPEFNAKWKEVARNDPNFDAAQHDFIKATHYDPAMAGLKSVGIDVSQRGAAVQDALWSTSVQFGAGSLKKNDGAIGLFRKAFTGKQASAMTDAEFVATLQDYKATNNDALFSKSSASVRAGTLARAGNEKIALLGLNAMNTLPVGMGGAGIASIGFPSISAANVPSAVPVKIPAMPDVQSPLTKLNSDSADARRGVVNVNIQEQVGQSPKDRSIAHIVSGGLGGA